MEKKYVNSLKIIFVFIICSLFLTVGYILYQKHSDSEYEVIKESNLSINFLGKKKISVKEGSKEIHFSVTNDSENTIKFYISLDDIKNFNEGVSIKLDDKVGIYHIDKTKESSVIALNNIVLEAKETRNFVIYVENKTGDYCSFDINIREISNKVETFSNILLTQNKLSKRVTNIAEELAISNEGLIEDVDDNGITYYFRGKVDNNYVSFANMTWRIIRINGDNSIRIILDSPIETMSAYTTNSDDYSFENSDVNKQLEIWYNDNLIEYDSYIAKSKFCDDTSKIETSLEFNNYIRNFKSYNSTFNCMGTKLSSKIGLISVDEAIYAGANISSGNKDYYLYDGSNKEFWTMSMAKINTNNFYTFLIGKDGNIIYNITDTTLKSIRPVINLKNEINIIGNGTKEEPFIVN